MTLAFWQAGNSRGRRARRARLGPRRAASARPPHRFAARIYEDMGADRPRRATPPSATRQRAPDDASALGAARPAAAAPLATASGAIAALSAPGVIAPDGRGPARPRARRSSSSGDIGGEVSACEAATVLEPESPQAWSRYAHALARTDRVTDALAACERALALGGDPEVRNLREQVLAAVPRALPDASRGESAAA